MTSAFPIRTLPLTALLALGVFLGNAEAQTTACDSKIQALEINSTTLHYLECGQGRAARLRSWRPGRSAHLSTAGASVRHELQGHRLQPAFLPAERSAASDRRQSSQQSRCGSASPDHAAESQSGDLGKLKRPTLLVTGEQSPAMFLLITAELERCLEGESQVMVPDAGHTMHRENTAFYNQAVLAFLQRR